MARALTSLSLVIPTRNEAANVDALVAAICAAMPGSSKELVFVDDSDDSTPALLQRLLAQTDCPGLIVQRANGNRDGGLSTAVVRGLQASSGAYICTMDADLQHPASAVPLLLDAAQSERADIVVGSRYVRGGSAAEGFDGAGRYAISQAARLAAHALLPAARWTTDPLSGFFLIRRQVVADVVLRPIGYKILLEILVRGRWRRIADVAYAFHSRNAGVSNATFREGMQFARHIAQLRILQPPARERVAVSAPVVSSALTVASIVSKAAARTNGHRPPQRVQAASNGAKAGSIVNGGMPPSKNGVEHTNAPR